jgi:antirestriction protein ArdC
LCCFHEGLPDRFYQTQQPPNTTIERISHADEFFRNTRAEIQKGGNQAFYSIRTDFIRAAQN